MLRFAVSMAWISPDDHLDTAAAQGAQVARDLLRPARAGHHPQERRRVPVRGASVDEDNAVSGVDEAPQQPRRDQPPSPPSEDDNRPVRHGMHLRERSERHDPGRPTGSNR